MGQAVGFMLRGGVFFKKEEMMAPLGRRTRTARRRAGETLDKVPTAATVAQVATPNRRAGTCFRWTYLDCGCWAIRTTAGRLCSGARVDECQVLRSPFGESSSGSNARTVISTDANLAQGAANSNDYFWPRCC